MRVVDDVNGPRAWNEYEVVTRAPNLEPLNPAVLLEHHAEVGVRLLHDLETRSLAHVDVAVPGVQPRDVFLGGEFTYVLEGVGTDWKYLAPLCDQDYGVIVVEDAS